MKAYIAANFFSYHFIIFLCWVVCCLSKNDSMLNQLSAVKDLINNGSAPICYHAHSGTKQSLIIGHWKKYTNEPLIVYPFCLMTKELGNRLGNYWTEVACADAIGSHFMAIHKQFDISGAFQESNYTSIRRFHKKTQLIYNNSTRLAFLNALPDIIQHQNPVEYSVAIERSKKECKCTRYCWQDIGSPWVNRTSYIGKYMLTAIDNYFLLTQGVNHNVSVVYGTIVEMETDFTNARIDEELPLIPDVTIQYRCGDNIQFSYMYGILPDTAFLPLIPKNAKYIYVLSDHPKRALHAQFTSRCHTILQGLFHYLNDTNPQATIVVKRGGDIFLDYARMAYSNITICSASTYCLWPALANTVRGGQVYFPLTPLIAGADNRQLAPDFGSKFIWLDDPVYSDFRKVRPWTNIVEILSGRMKMP